MRPAEYAVELTEFFQWNEGVFYSTFHGRINNFRVFLAGNEGTDLYNEGSALQQLFGTAGLPGAFYVQLRDRFGNLVQEKLPDAASLNVNIIGQNKGQLIYLGTEASPEVPEVNYMGWGIYAVRFFSNEASTFTVRVEIDGTFVKKISQNPVSLAWIPDGDFYELRIRPSVTDPAMCEAFGPGLRGALVERKTTVTVVAKDELGNKRDEAGPAQVLPRLLARLLDRCSCTQAKARDVRWLGGLQPPCPITCFHAPRLP